jgi:hypothetical protein
MCGSLEKRMTHDGHLNQAEMKKAVEASQAAKLAYRTSQKAVRKVGISAMTAGTVLLAIVVGYTFLTH